MKLRGRPQWSGAINEPYDNSALDFFNVSGWGSVNQSEFRHYLIKKGEVDLHHHGVILTLIHLLPWWSAAALADWSEYVTKGPYQKNLIKPENCVQSAQCACSLCTACSQRSALAVFALRAVSAVCACSLCTACSQHSVRLQSLHLL